MFCIFFKWDIKIVAKIDFRKPKKFNCLVEIKVCEFAKIRHLRESFLFVTVKRQYKTS